MTKTWENLRPASFRGVAFEVESHSESGGRRVELHEYPLRDTPYAEDLGKKAGKWQIEAFLVNGKSGYAERRDKLREALNASGPGTLIHPYLGELSVSVDGYSLKETTREGGYCTFSISFVEAGQPVEPDVEKDTAANVLDKAEAAKEAATAGFLDEYMPLLEDLEGLAGKVPALLSEATAFLGTPLSILSRAQSAASSVLALPDRLASRILGYLGTIRQLGGIATSGLKMNALTALLGKKSAGTASSWLVTSNGVIAGIVGETSWPQAGGGSIGGGTPSPETPGVVASTVANRAETPLIDLIAAGVVIEAAIESADADYGTADDALASRDAVLEAIDEVQRANCSDAVFTALSELAAAVNEDLTTRGAELPKLGSATLFMSMPALAASYRLYGDVGQADAIVARNRIRHPGRVPGGVPLEVIRG
ncbi:DNA circularization N-terminal domain-containing protein [Bilophila wadsworthia]|uniref:DNA circularization protein n=1 Tax=Bilophila wadsworthia TaxID=35833 RepID=UPI001D0BB963|nr:DNA circularization N-terminal domain-containing protein [Bilophila wadsworthia]MCB8570025.1 DNA circularization N-terminal domain-containing protein [Bilophila wadsworthia]MCC2714044.1 DNA circularization N-terminal domain-containing protein [Bilophila wadsworthia]